MYHILWSLSRFSKGSWIGVLFLESTAMKRERNDVKPSNNAPSTYIRRTPHPVIVTTMDNKDPIRVLLCSYCTTITGWGVHLKHTRQSSRHWRCPQVTFQTQRLDLPPRIKTGNVFRLRVNIVSRCCDAKAHRHSSPSPEDFRVFARILCSRWPGQERSRLFRTVLW